MIRWSSVFVHRISVCAKNTPWLPLSGTERMEMNLIVPFSRLGSSEPKVTHISIRMIMADEESITRRL